jgi:hypothetical protein
MTYDIFKLSTLDTSKRFVTLGLQEGGKRVGRRSGGRSSKNKYHVLKHIHRTTSCSGPYKGDAENLWDSINNVQVT